MVVLRSDTLGKAVFRDRSRSDEKNDTQDTSDLTKLEIREVVGEIFDAPNNAVLIHACNCQGSWGAGIAKAFKEQYPKAYELYQRHCITSPAGTALEGTAILIPPVDDGRRHYIGCLFTSGQYGKKKAPPHTILENTGPATEQLMNELALYPEIKEAAEVRMCRINSGLFKVPWNMTRSVLKRINVKEGMPSHITVYSLQ